MREVVAAMICSENTFLICQRPAHKMCGGLWEFPGGKVEAGETGSQAVVREIREELGLEIAVDGELSQVTHRYPELDVHLTLYRTHIISGIPRMLEHSDIRWITADEIGGYVFCPADTQILKKLGI